MSKSKQNMATEWMDPDDAPELTDEFFEQANEYRGRRLVRRGRPEGGSKKVSTTVTIQKVGIS